MIECICNVDAVVVCGVIGLEPIRECVVDACNDAMVPIYNQFIQNIVSLSK